VLGGDDAVFAASEPGLFVGLILRVSENVSLFGHQHPTGFALEYGEVVGVFGCGHASSRPLVVSADVTRMQVAGRHVHSADQLRSDSTRNVS
jgi:hypothetical protein